MSVGPREIFVTGIVAALLALACGVVFYGPGVATGSELFFTHDVSHSDIWHLNLPIKRFYQEELHQGRLPLWCPTLGTGFPLHAQGQVGALDPFNLLLYGTLPLALAFNWSVLLHAALAAAAAACLARELGSNRGGAWLAGIVFAFAGFFVVHVKHPDMAAAAAWAPVLLLLVERFARLGGAGRLVLLSLASAAMLLAGHPQMAYYALLVASGWTIALAIHGRRIALACGVGYALLLGALLAAPQLLPTRELNALGPRAAGLSLAEATEWRYAWSHLVAFLRPYAFGDPALASFEQTGSGKMLFWEMTGYVGILPLLLALAAFKRSIPRWHATRLVALFAVSILLALGPSGGLFHFFWSVVPGFRYFRFQSRFLLFADLALALLAGLGWTALSAGLLGRWRGAARAAAAGAVIGICFLDLTWTLSHHNPTIAAERWLAPPPSAERIAREESERERGPFRIVGNDPRRQIFQSAYARAGGWNGDLGPYDAAKNQLGPNLSALYGIDNLEIFFPLYPDWMGHTLRLLAAPRSREDLDPTRARPGRIHPGVASLYNVRYVLDAFGFSFAGAEPLESYPAGEREIRLLRNDGAFPRAFLVPSSRAVVDEPVSGDAVPAPVLALLAADFDPRREVLIVTPPGEAPPAPLPAGEPIATPVEFVRYEPQEVELRVVAPRPCWLVLSDTDYPGWRAMVNGVATPIHRANVAVRAVRLDAGRAEVIFRYEPRSLRLGWIAAAIGAVLAASLPLMARGRRPATRS